MKIWIAFWNILKKDIRNYYLKPPNISWGLIFPLSWTLMQIIRSPDASLLELLPGLMAMSILFGTTSMLAVTITFERSGHSFDRLLLAPLPLPLMLAAKTGGSILFGLFNALVPLLLAIFLVTLPPVNWLLAFLALLLTALTSTLLGLVVAISAKQVFEAQTLSNFSRFPMLFLCGLFVTLSSLPSFLRPVAYLLPLTYGTDLLRRAFGGGSHFAASLSLPLLLLFTGLLFVLSLIQVQRKWIL